MERPMFFPLKWIRSEWGMAMAIENTPFPSTVAAMERAYELSEDLGDFKKNYSVAVLDEDGNYSPIPKGVSDGLKKGYL